VKKDAPVKKELKDEPEETPALEEDERPWWVKELAMADAACHPDNPAYEPGLHMLQTSSLNDPKSMDETSALVWSAEQSDALIDLTKDDNVLQQVKKKE
jgi:hypothetical protein